MNQTFRSWFEDGYGGIWPKGVIYLYDEANDICTAIKVKKIRFKIKY